MNKLNLVLGSLLLSSSSMSAVNGNVADSTQMLQPDSVTTTVSQAADYNDEIVDKPEQMPEFPGGMSGLLNYLRQKINYPKLAKDNFIQGRVIVEFVVDKDGSVTECLVKKKVHPLLDAEAKRVVKAMPKWKPGIQKGKPVRVRYTVPILFNLPDTPKTKSLNALPQLVGYKGGVQAFVQNNIKYPQEAVDNQLEGLVVVEYVVDKKGDVTDVKIIKPLHPLLDEEVLRVMKSMPRWKPGRKNWKPIRVKRAQSVIFEMSEQTVAVDSAFMDSLSNVYKTPIQEVKIRPRIKK